MKFRMQRKNRNNAYGGCNDTSMVGVDLNRNFGVDFGVAAATSDPCSDYFTGPRPFSEPET